MGACKHPNCSAPLFKPLSKAHDYLCRKSRHYHEWHHHPHHKKVHVGFLAVYLMLIGSLLYSVLPHNAGAASHFLANWEQGSSSFNATTPNGDAANNGAVPATIVDGYNSTGALNVDPRQSVRYNSLGNIDLSRSQIDANFRLKYPLSGADNTEYKFNNPGQIALDPTDPTVAYVADTSNNRIVRMHWNGSDWDSWYAYGTQGPGTGQFSAPNSIVYDPTYQVVYVGDSRNCRVVRLHWNGSGWDSWHEYGYCGVDPEQFNTMAYGFSSLIFDSGTQTLIVGDPGRIIRVTWDEAAKDWKDWTELVAGEGNNPEDLNFTGVGGMFLDGSGTNSVLYFASNVAGVTIVPTEGDPYAGDTTAVTAIRWNGSRWVKIWQGTTREGIQGEGLIDAAVATGLTVDTTTDTLYLTPPGNKVYSYDVSGSSLPPATEITAFNGNAITTVSKTITFDSANSVLYMFDPGNANPLIRTHKTIGSWDQYSKKCSSGATTPSISPTDTAFDSATNTLFVMDSGAVNTRLVVMHITNGMADSWYTYGMRGTGVGQFSGYFKNMTYDSDSKAIYIVDTVYENGSASGFRLIRLPWSTESGFGTWYENKTIIPYGNSAAQWGVGLAFDPVSKGLYVSTANYDAGYSVVESRLRRLTWNGSQMVAGPVIAGVGGNNFDFSNGNAGRLTVDSANSVIYATDTNGIGRLHWNGSSFDALNFYAIPPSDPEVTITPTDLAFDKNAGVLYMVDEGNYHVIRMAWNGSNGFNTPVVYGKNGNIADYSGSSGRSREGQFASPKALAFDDDGAGSGDVYVADTSNTRVSRMRWDSDNSTFTAWGTFTDPYHYVMSTSGQYPLRIRFNVATSRLEFYLSAGSKETFIQTDKLTLIGNVWYSLKVQYDSTNGKLLIGVYNTSPVSTISEITTSAEPWVAPTTLGGNFYIGSDKVTNYDQRAIGGAIDNFEISSLAPPPTPTTLRVTPTTYSPNQHFEFSWQAGVAGDDSNASNFSGYQFIVNGTAETKADPNNWTDVDTALTYTLDSGTNSFPGVVQGANTFTVRAKGLFDNYSAESSIAFYWSNQMATAPESLTITSPDPGGPLGKDADHPAADNNFTITWNTPSGSTGGEPSYLKYHYSVDAYPRADDSATKTLDCSRGACTTATNVKATKQTPAPSIFFILSEGQNGLINWHACDAVGGKTIADIRTSDDIVSPSLCAIKQMYVSTPAPGIPRNALAKDTSNKDKQIFEDVLRWDPPATQGNGVAAYEICRSTDDVTYAAGDCHETSETYYYQTGLESRLYYYKIRARDAAHQYGDYTDPISITPTGDFKVPPILKSDSISVSAKSSSATIRWSTQDEELKSVHKANSYIEYGVDKDHVGKAKGGFDQGSKEYVDDHEVKLTGLQPDNTKYYYRLVWYDINGNMGHYEQFDESKPFATIFTTSARPTILNMKVLDITLNSATITYETSVPATTEIAYGTDRNNLTSTCTFASNGYDTQHQVNLPCPELFNDGPLIKPLNHTSTYYYKIKGKDTDGEPIDVGAVYDFKTLTMPQILAGSVQVDQDKEAPSTTYRFTWKTNIKTSSVVNYTDDKGKKQSRTIPDMVTDHDVTVPNLADQSVYTFEISGVDEYWINIETPYTTSITTPKDSRPPKVSNLTVEVKSSGFGTSQKAQLVVTWETDEPGTSQVEYDQGISGDSYANKSKEDMAYSTSHAVILADLEPSKIYHLRAVTTDSAGNVGHSEDTTTITGRQQNSVLDIIINSLQKSLGWLFGIFQPR